MKKEIWKDIPGASFMQASSFGRIRSKDRTVLSKNRWGGTQQIKLRGLIRKPHMCKDGYFRLPIMVNGKYHKETLVHRQVAVAFLNTKTGKHVNHKNGIKSDNRLENLEMVTIKENLKHARETGLMRTSGGRDLLSREDIIAIRAFHIPYNGTQLRLLAKIFNRGILCIQRIASGQTYGHVK